MTVSYYRQNMSKYVPDIKIRKLSSKTFGSSFLIFSISNVARRGIRWPEPIGHFQVAVCLCVKTSFRAKTQEDVFRLRVHFRANQTNFHLKRFARGLVLKRKHKVNGYLFTCWPHFWVALLVGKVLADFFYFQFSTLHDQSVWILS